MEKRAGPITLEQRPAIAAAADPVEIGKAVIGDEALGRVVLRNPGTGPLNIASVIADQIKFRVTFPIGPFVIQSGSEIAVEILYGPSAEEQQTANLLVASNATDQPQFSVRLNGEGVDGQTPILRLNSTATDFGAVEIGELREANVVGLNASLTDLELSWAVQGVGFGSVGPLSETTVASGEQFSIPLTFTGGEAGDATGSLTLTSNDPDQPTTQVILVARTLSPPDAAPEGPRINQGGVVDAASFQGVIARGGIGSIFGVELAASVEIASDVPLARELAGVKVEVDGHGAPLFFTSPTQINFQVPFEVAANGTSDVVVIRDDVRSAPVSARLADFAPGMFVNPANGEPIVTRHPEGALITSGNPAEPEDVLTLFLTGIGDVTNVPTTGAAAGVPLSAANVTPTVTIGGVRAQILFAGLAPFFVGLAQINLIMPDLGVAAGPAQNLAALPLVIDFDGQPSKPVNLPVSLPIAASPDISVSAVALDFGNVNIGQTSDQTLTIGNTGSGVLSVSAITFDDPQFTVVLPAGGFSIAPGASRLAAFRFTPTAAGVQSATLTIASNDPSNPMLSIGVRGNAGSSALGNFVLSEQSIDFGSADTGQSVFRLLTIQNTGTAAATIQQVSTNSAEFTVALQATPSSPEKAVPITVNPGGQEPLLVTFAPTSAGSKQAEVSIDTDIGSQPLIKIALAGNGSVPAANGTIVVPTATLSFGGTPVNRTREVTTTVHNAGSADLTVNSVTADDPQFSLALPVPPFVVTPDERLPLRLHFTPTSVGTFNAMLAFESSDPSTPTANVAVTGRGVEPAAAIFSDSFDRADSTIPCDLGRSDNLVGGSTAHRYAFVLQGAALRDNALLNLGRPRGGVIFTTERTACPTRGTDLGQDLNIRASVTVPFAGQRNTQAGPFFRAPLLTTGTDLLGGAGFWVVLDSSGQVRVRQLNPDVVLATSPVPIGFDASVPHTIEIAVRREQLEVAVDGRQRTFTQGNLAGRRQVTLQPSAGMNEGGAGLAFGADTGPAAALGQTLDNLVVTEFEPLTGIPIED